MNIKQVALNVLGVVLIIMALGLGAALVLPYFVRIDTRRPQKQRCEQNLKQIGLGFRQWMIDYGGHYPFNLSTNSGGTRELRSTEASGLDRDSFWHFMVLSNELNSPRLLVCPQDRTKVAAPSFLLQPENVTYRVNSTLADAGQSNDVLVVCPIEGNVLRRDGSVTQPDGPRR